MKSDIYRFRFRTGEVLIDHNKCVQCANYACLKADSLFGTGVLRIRHGRPVLTTTLDDAKRLCNECLTCELYCQAYGNGGVRIVLDQFAD